MSAAVKHRMAAASLRPGAASCRYGRDIVGFLDRKPARPTILRFGGRDRFIPLKHVSRVRAALSGIPAYLHPAGHRFDAARERSLQLFRRHIG